tara:strand:- start:55 stop:297 length:243 start_codon:yes stop_codon:yes gene_type:complete
MQDKDEETLIEPNIGDLVQVWGDDYGICGIGIVLTKASTNYYKVYWFDTKEIDIEHVSQIELWGGTFAKVDPRVLEYLDF